MVNTIVANMVAFLKSTPTNVVILVIICLIMKFGLKKSWKDCGKVILVYALVGVLLGIFGICMPDFLTIGNWIADIARSIFGSSGGGEVATASAAAIGLIV